MGKKQRKNTSTKRFNFKAEQINIKSLSKVAQHLGIKGVSENGRVRGITFSDFDYNNKMQSSSPRTERMIESKLKRLYESKTGIRHEIIGESQVILELLARNKESFYDTALPMNPFRAIATINCNTKEPNIDEQRKSEMYKSRTLMELLLAESGQYVDRRFKVSRPKPNESNNNLCYDLVYMTMEFPHSAEIVRIVEESIRNLENVGLNDILAMEISDVAAFVEASMHSYARRLSLSASKITGTESPEELLVKFVTGFDYNEKMEEDPMRIAIYTFVVVRLYLWIVQNFGIENQEYFFGIKNTDTTDQAMEKVIGDKAYEELKGIILKTLTDPENSDPAMLELMKTNTKCRDYAKTALHMLSIVQTTAVKHEEFRVEVSSKCNELAGLLEKAQRKANEKENNYNIVKKENSSLEKNNKHLSEKIGSLESKLKNVQNVIDEAETKSNKAKKALLRVNKLTLRISSLEDKLADTTYKMDSLETENKQLKELVAQLNRDLSAANQEEEIDRTNDVKDYKILFMGGPKKWGEILQPIFTNSYVHDSDELETSMNYTKLDCIVICATVVGHTTVWECEKLADRLGIPIINVNNTNIKLVSQSIYNVMNK